MPLELEYDLAVGVSEGMLNGVSAKLHESNPGIFSAEEVTEELTMYWEVVTAPVFDLSATNPTLTARREAVRDQISGQPYAAEFLSGVDNGSNFFSIICPDVTMRLKFGNHPPGEAIHLIVTAHCDVRTDTQSGRIIFEVLWLESTSTGDPFTDKILEEQLLPALQRLLTQIFQGVDIPPFEIAGITLSTPVMTILKNYLIATMFVLDPVSGSPGGLRSTGGEFFALLSQRCMKLAAQYGMAYIADNFPIKGEDTTGIPGYSASYQYEVEFADPFIEPNGDKLTGYVPARGSVAARVTGIVPLVPPLVEIVTVGISYDVSTKPYPGGTFQLTVIGGNLWVKIISLDEFTVDLEATGNPVDWALSVAVELVVEPVINTVTPLLLELLEGLNFEVWSIPEIEISVGDFTLVCEVIDLNLFEYNRGVGMTGKIELYVEPGDAQSSSGELEKATPCSLERCLYQSAAVGQRLTGGIYFGGVYLECGKGVITEYTPTALAAEGQYDVNIVLQGEKIVGKGDFSARISLEENGAWNIHLSTTGTWVVNYDGPMGCTFSGGNCVFRGIVDIGSLVEVSVKVKPSDGADSDPSYVRLYAEILSPNPQILPTGYAKYTPDK